MLIATAALLVQVQERRARIEAEARRTPVLAAAISKWTMFLGDDCGRTFQFRFWLANVGEVAETVKPVVGTTTYVPTGEVVTFYPTAARGLRLESKSEVFLRIACTAHVGNELSNSLLSQAICDSLDSPDSRLENLFGPICWEFVTPSGFSFPSSQWNTTSWIRFAPHVDPPRCVTYAPNSTQPGSRVLSIVAEDSKQIDWLVE